MTVMINGKQKRVRRPATIDGMLIDDFIRENADPIWLHQHGYWEYIDCSDDGDYRINCQVQSETDLDQTLFGDPPAEGSVHDQTVR